MMKILKGILLLSILILLMLSCERREQREQKNIRTLTAGDVKQEIDMLEKQIEAHPYDADAHLQLALFYGEEKPKEVILKHYLKAIELQPQNPDYRLHLGIFYFNVKDYSRAIDELTKTIALDDKQFKAYKTQGMIYSIQGRKAEASKRYKEALRVLPEFAQRYRARSNYQLDTTTEEASIKKALAELEK